MIIQLSNENYDSLYDACVCGGREGHMTHGCMHVYVIYVPLYTYIYIHNLCIIISIRTSYIIYAKHYVFHPRAYLAIPKSVSSNR